MAIAVTALTLLAGWGGTVYGWLSPRSWGSPRLSSSPARCSTAPRPGPPIRSSPSACSPTDLRAHHHHRRLRPIGLFSTVSYIPTFLQMVHGYGATASGYLTLPAVLGMIVATSISGVVSSKTAIIARSSSAAWPSWPPA
ncbi:MAG: hypothetical protein R3D59_09335 [Paracoccaceae bacterium]